MMKNGCKMAVFSVAMHYFFHPDAIIFSSRCTIIFIATHNYLHRESLFKPPAGHHLSLLSVLI